MCRKGFIILLVTLFLTGCDHYKDEAMSNLFHSIFVHPIDILLHGFGHLYRDNYGLAIITIVLLIRLFLLPFMLAQVKNMHMMREKTKIVQPQIDDLRNKIKIANSQEEKSEAQKSLIDFYKQYDINPLKNVLGCLPIMIQLPILLGLIITLKYPTGDGIDRYPDFLWFNLTEPNLWISLIAAIVYFFQPLVNACHYPKEQRKTHYVLMVLSPIFITYISLHSAAALGLYWSVGGLFLIIQMHFAHSYYGKLAHNKAIHLQDELDEHKLT
ncbi:lipoprotein [Staphylococcus xylosus]|uniref:membrane protein insertase YidC n=1 Tax=Staphylococcus xylosus TaxID=1288 RepID=UPI00085BD6F1|nr:membrane protein insertase YidC [Staphylococcus xylosus]SCT99189.1 lipoprotein [Staphylococcus xylosus]